MSTTQSAVTDTGAIPPAMDTDSVVNMAVYSDDINPAKGSVKPLVLKPAIHQYFTPSSPRSPRSPRSGMKRPAPIAFGDLTAEQASQIGGTPGSGSSDNGSASPGDIPDDLVPWIKDMLISIKRDTMTTSSNVNDLQNRVAVLEDQANNDGANHSTLQQKFDHLEHKFDIVCGRLIRAESKIARQTADIIDLRTRSMRDNIIIRTKGDKYKATKDENTASKFRSFVGTEMRVANSDNIAIARAHRMGFSSGDTNSMMIAKVSNDEDQRRIFDNVKSLKDSAFSISKQQPLEIEERKQFAWAEFKRAKELKQKARFDHMGRLFIEDIHVSKFDPVVLPTTSSIGNDANNDPTTLKVASSDECALDGHKFKAWAVEVNSLQGVRNAYDHLLKLGVLDDASHVPFAFRYMLNTGGLIENFDSDGDHYVGLQTLRIFQTKKCMNVAVFLNHETSSAPMGSKKKMECLKHVVSGSLMALAYKTE